MFSKVKLKLQDSITSISDIKAPQTKADKVWGIVGYSACIGIAVFNLGASILDCVNNAKRNRDMKTVIQMTVKETINSILIYKDEEEFSSEENAKEEGEE